MQKSTISGIETFYVKTPRYVEILSKKVAPQVAFLQIRPEEVVGRIVPLSRRNNATISKEDEDPVNAFRKIMILTPDQYGPEYDPVKVDLLKKLRHKSLSSVAKGLRKYKSS